MARKCVSCSREDENLRVVRRSGGSCCPTCRVWVRMSLRRTRKITKYLIPKNEMDFARIEAARRELIELRANDRKGSWADERMPIDMGISYFGPCNDRAWETIIDRIILRTPIHKVSGFGEPSNLFTMTPTTQLARSVIMEKMAMLNDMGVICLPSAVMLREQVTHLMIGTYGHAALEQFNASLFCWLANEKEYVGCNRDAWGTGFELIQQVIGELGEKFEFNDHGYQVTGTSGNVYHIRPRIHAPYYGVRREYGRQLIPVCIDPIGAMNVMFADVLVTLLLSLADDKVSAKRIDTLHSHVFGPNRRVRDANRMWRQALAAHPPANADGANPERVEHIAALQRRMRFVVDRFQTNIDRWSEFTTLPEQAEEEGEEDE
jgi:hypothetical protein